jgi:hypothetical protein
VVWPLLGAVVHVVVVRVGVGWCAGWSVGWCVVCYVRGVCVRDVIRAFRIHFVGGGERGMGEERRMKLKKRQREKGEGVRKTKRGMGRVGLVVVVYVFHLSSCLVDHNFQIP